MAGDAIHPQFHDAAAFAARHHISAWKPTFKGKGSAAAGGLLLQKLHGFFGGQRMGGLLVTHQHQPQLTAVIPGVLKSPDNIQGDHQAALAVVDTGTVDTAVPQ